MSKRTVFVRSNGCPGRDLDVSRLMTYFEQNGCRIVASPRKAETIIFLACSFKESRKLHSLDWIERYGQYQGELIVAGCLPEIAPEELRQKHQGRFISTRAIHEIDRLFPEFPVRFTDTVDANYLYERWSALTTRVRSEFNLSKNFFKQISSFRLFEKGTRQIPYLRVGWGCDDTCTYCGIRKAIGPLASKPISVLTGEYRRLLGKGHRTFKIYSDNVGSYGSDIGSSLPELLDALAHADEPYRVEWLLLHMDPKWAVRYQSEIAKWIGQGKITEMLFPIQSGHERILKRMNRYSDTQRVLECLRDFKQARSTLKIYTQIIVGFPSETEEELLETLDFIEQARFDLVMPFQYFDSPDTPASRMEGKQDERTITDRMRMVGELLEHAGIKWITL